MTVLSHMYIKSDKIRLGAAMRAQDQVPSLHAALRPLCDRRGGVSERRGQGARATLSLLAVSSHPHFVVPVCRCSEPPSGTKS